ncbi:MAG TPA: Hsp20/alpha crystallin family protein [Anaerolineae bacterium]|nr:Hsp20/alpha crystallin family protein [Anaerolineae bacterium]
MTTLVRWNPIREMMALRNEMDRLFDTALDYPALRWEEATTWGLPLDVAENDDAYIVKASVPGINPENLDITLSDNVLTIKGEFEEDKEIEEEQYQIRERRMGSFARSVTLPVAVVADKVEATYEDGVLTLTVPKAEEVKPRHIQIKARKNGQKTIEGKVVKDK